MDNDQAADMTNVWSHSAKGRLGSSENPGLSNLHVGERLLQQAGRDVLHTDLAACNGFQAEALPVQQPALVIIGDDDKMTPPEPDGGS